MGEKPQITIGTDKPVISLQRVFDAPRQRVFEAFTRAQDVERWFKPDGLRVCECEIDLRVGGRWRFALRGPQGEMHRLSGEFREIDAPRRLVQTIRSDDAPQMEGVETLVFAETDGKTLLTSTIAHVSTENRDRHVASGLEKRAAQLLDRLADHLQFGDAAPTDDIEAQIAAPKKRRAGAIGRIAAALAAAVALAGGGFYWASQRAPSVENSPAAAPAVHKVSASGAVVALGAVALRAEAQGPIELADCEVGGEVVTGSLCATIDERARESARDSAEAAVAVAEEQLQTDEASVESAKAALERETRAGKRRASARAAAEKAQAALDRAQQRFIQDREALQQARAAFASATVNMSRARILSPIDGFVVSRKGELGATVAEGDELFVVAPDPAALQVEAHVADPGAVQIGDQATVTIDALGNRAFTGKVGRIGPPDSKDKEKENKENKEKEGDADLVVIEASDPDHSLKAGMTAKVEIETRPRPQ